MAGRRINADDMGQWLSVEITMRVRGDGCNNAVMAVIYCKKWVFPFASVGHFERAQAKEKGMKTRLPTNATDVIDNVDEWLSSEATERKSECHRLS